MIFRESKTIEDKKFRSRQLVHFIRKGKIEKGYIFGEPFRRPEDVFMAPLYYHVSNLDKTEVMDVPYHAIEDGK